MRSADKSGIVPDGQRLGIIHFNAEVTLLCGIRTSLPPFSAPKGDVAGDERRIQANQPPGELPIPAANFEDQIVLLREAKLLEQFQPVVISFQAGFGGCPLPDVLLVGKMTLFVVNDLGFCW